MSSHADALSSICRVCREYIPPTNRNRSTSSYAKELESVYGINITTDSHLIHPKLICSKHHSALTRFRKLGTKPAKPANTASFVAHSDESCDICSDFITVSQKNVAKRPPRGSLRPKPNLSPHVADQFLSLDSEDQSACLDIILSKLSEFDRDHMFYTIGNFCNGDIKLSSQKNEERDIQKLSKYDPKASWKTYTTCTIMITSI